MPWRHLVKPLSGQAGRRCFTTGSSLQASYGFIGLGRMGEYSLKYGNASMGQLLTFKLHRLPNGQESSSKDPGVRHHGHK